MAEEHPTTLTFTEQGMQGIPAFSEVLKKVSKSKVKELKITYEVVGTAEENQESLDRVFDKIFDEVQRRRECRKGY